MPPAPLHTHTCVHATNPNAHTPNGQLEKNAGCTNAVGTPTGKAFIKHDVTSGLAIIHTRQAEQWGWPGACGGTVPSCCQSQTAAVGLATPCSVFCAACGTGVLTFLLCWNLLAPWFCSSPALSAELRCSSKFRHGFASS